jgi:outer membrane protein OmpA-like peptidoglycan-associated protein
MARGIAAGRIESYGYGKAKPLVESASEEARQLNRRVEVKFTE